jgi:hypothetical protein
MNELTLNRKIAGIEPWKANYGEEMERRTADDMSWYDLSMNCNSVPCRAEFAVIVTAWAGQLKWLSSVLESYRKSGALVILSYDNPFYAWIPRNAHEITRCMPNMKHYLLANCMVSKHITYDSDKRNGWFWNVRYAQGILRQFDNIKHVYVTNGDCCVDRPEGFKDIIDLMGDADLMAGQSTESLIHTAAMMFKRDAFDRVFDVMAEWMRVPVLGSRSPEVMLREAVSLLNVKVKHAVEQPLDKDGTVDMYARYRPPSTWGKILGFRNLFAEYETAGNEGAELMQFKAYVDSYEDWIYWGGEERETICRYWETGDRRYLLMFWDRWEDSDYNRLYYPLEHYGKEPIYGSC